MKSRQSSNTNSASVPLSKRRLKTKPVLTLLGILLFGNIFWFILWLFAALGGGASDEDTIIASIDGENISREQWMAEMERYYGKETLQKMVNQKVMEKAAKEYKIEVTDKEIDLEIALMIASSEMDSTLQHLDEDELREQVKAQLILEKVLSKDIVIEEEQMKAYYEENESLYNIPTTYRTSLIVVDTKKEAKSVLKELKNGSDFAVLARERSTDQLSASLGGDIGYVTSNHSPIDPAIQTAIQHMKKGDISSSPILLKDGRYAILQVNEVKEGKSFPYKDVEGQIKRTLAMEQLSSTITPEMFWKEFNATWFYGK